MLVSWAEIFKRAELASKRHISNFEKQREDEFIKFRNIIDGKNDKITEDSTKNIFDESYKLFIDEIKKYYR